MRMKDEIKQRALISATIATVNESGLASSSVSKIAKKAGLSPATLYIYYKDKEDLLASIYMDVKIEMSNYIINEITEESSLKKIFSQLWKAMFKYISCHREEFMFIEQFSSSPCCDIVNKKEMEKHFEPITGLIKDGIKKGEIKNVDMGLIKLFLFSPLMVLAKDMIKQGGEFKEKLIKEAFELSWDSIKL